MKDGRVMKIDYSQKRLGHMADQYYNEGKYLPALRFAYKQLELYGGDGDIYTRLCDIYEGMGLHDSALNWWFHFLDIAEPEDLPDIYEGLAVNFLNLGNEGQSAYYYNRLIDADDTLPEETKMDIAEAFSSAKKDKFRFVYPPLLADYSKEVSIGTRALKAGDCNRAILELGKVAKGAKEYVSAQEMQAVAHLLVGETEQAEQICKALLEDYPDNIRAKATLAAVYLEQGRSEESCALAKELAAKPVEETDDLYKVATVCCENGLHAEAYEKFCILDKRLPYDGRMLYFKAVSAYKCDKIDEAEDALAELCVICPEAEVAKYYLKAIRNYKEGVAPKPELIYFYHLPQEERESRCRSLIRISESPKDEAQIFGLIALHDGYFHWCFDEMDGADHDLQHLGLIAAVHVRADEFLRCVFLDPAILDVLKIETMRLLYERNEDLEFGIVLCNIYRKAYMQRIKIGRKKRKRFIGAYARIASKFVLLDESYGDKIKFAAETLYRALEKYDSLDLIDNMDDCACAIFVMAGLKELGSDMHNVAKAFDADPARVGVLLSVVVSDKYDMENKTEETEKKNEAD